MLFLLLLEKWEGGGQRAGEVQARSQLSLPPPVCQCPPAEDVFGSLTQTNIRYAEMEKTAKNKISHRGRALEKLQAWFAEQTSK